MTSAAEQTFYDPRHESRVKSRRLDPNPQPIVVGSNGVAWGVPDIDAAHRHVVAQGATPHEPITNGGHDIKVSAVADPFGNLIGLNENPHFKVVT